MKILTVFGLFLDVVGVVILGVGEVRRSAAALRALQERSPEAFAYDVQQKPWYARPLLVLGATLGARSAPQNEPPPYREFPYKVCGFFLLLIGFLLQLLAALCGVTRLP